MIFAGSLITDDPIRQKIRDFYRTDEDKVLDYLLPIAEVGVAKRTRAWERARQLVVQIRKDQVGKGGVDALLNEFALSTEEGVVLMCLAEALLRVPDKITMDRLIRDKLSVGDWSSHIGNSDSLFVNASSWGLLLTGKLVTYSDDNREKQFGVLKKTVGRLGEPVIRKSVRYAMQIMGTQFVMGTNIDKAVERAKEQEAKGYTYSYDMLGEGARTMNDADRYFDSYMTAIEAIGKAAQGRGPEKSPGISIKLSAIHPRYEFTHRDRVVSELIPRLKTLALAAKKYDIGFTVDAEEADRLDISLDIIEAVFADKDLDGWEGFGIALQAYMKRGIYVVEWVRQLTQRVGRKMMVRLVKGAYWDSEVKESQAEGYADFPVFSRKPSTDVSYQACAKKLLEYRDTIYPQFATHNAYTVATILEMAEQREGFEFQRLHGMGDALYDQVVGKEGVSCRVYAPVGEHADLLAYLVRRLLENGANSSFVNNIVDESISVESLLTDPVEQVRNWQSKRNSLIPLSVDLYGDSRVNSRGVDLTDVDAITAMRDNMQNWFENAIAQTPVDGAQPVKNPANHDEVIGYLTHHNEDQLKGLVDKAQDAFADWSTTNVEYRASLLRDVADALENNMDELIAICTKEAGKTIVDGVAEVREAVDFCRYYASQAETLFANNQVEARGVILCISPWNFPLAIFLGQVAAAIAAGNTVVAKPAEQTSLVAIRTVELMREAGLPEGVVELTIARGSVIGATIVPDERIQGIMFTGSTATGTWISRKLAERRGDPVPLIAETGGQNAMLVDSTALPEQVVDDVVASGFQSAGQRCSALRVLFLQEDVADKIITMLKGAMQEIHVGDPAMLSTDSGPVIDEKALTRLNEHVEYLSDKATLHFKCATPNMEQGNFFFAPRLYEIDNLSVLKEEVFGPVVHIIRFKAEELDNVVEQINATGFGLTMGIHSRIQHVCHDVASRIKAGNIYVNRNMIGAVVGVQPFGGRGLSGTGPKAGGPAYLTRLVKEQQVIAGADDAAIESAEAHLLGAVDSAIKVNDVMRQASPVASRWMKTSLNDRISVVRRFLAEMAVSGLSTQNADATLERARHQALLAEKRLSAATVLPGPTGESNTLHLESRGVIALIQDDETSQEDFILMLISSLMAGNTVIAAAEGENAKAQQQYEAALLQAGLPRGGFQCLPLTDAKALLSHEDLHGSAVHPSSALKNYVARYIASREGAILPTLCEHTDEQWLMRQLTEKTITVDTTAAGGNASLMTMSENL